MAQILGSEMIDLKALRETAAREIRRGAAGLCPPQTVIALLDRLDAQSKAIKTLQDALANHFYSPSYAASQAVKKALKDTEEFQ